MITIVVVVLALAAAGCALVNWRQAVLMLVGWGLVEGFVRRVLPGQPAGVMLVDDGLAFLCYLSFIYWQMGQRKAWQPHFVLPLICFGLFVVIGMFNPRNPSLWFGLVGFHAYIWYVPLLWLGYFVFEDWERARRFFWWFCVLSIPMALLALYQYRNFGSLPVALAPVQRDIAYHTAAGLVREGIKMVPAFFVNGEKYARYSLMAFCISLGLLVDGQGTTFQRRATIAAAVASAAGIFFSGRRSPLYFALIAFAWLMFGFYTKLGLRRAYRWLAVLVLAAAGVLSTARTENPNALYYQESTAAIPTRARWLWGDMADSFLRAGLIGFGTGTESQGMDYVPGGAVWAANSPDSAVNLWGETGLGKITEELGILGVLFFIVLALTMAAAWFRNLRKLRGTAPYALGAALAVYFVMILAWFAKGHQILGDPVTLVEFWFAMGIFFAMPCYRARRERPLHPEPVILAHRTDTEVP